VFTFLSALVTNVWQLAVLRLLAGIGIGGEWAMGGTFVAEEWPENRRRAGAASMWAGHSPSATARQPGNAPRLRRRRGAVAHELFLPPLRPAAFLVTPRRS